MIDYLLKFGRVLIVARLATKKKQCVVAKEIGVNPCTVSDWELGGRLPAEKNIAKIAKSYESDEQKLREIIRLAMKEKRDLHFARFHKIRQERSAEEMFGNIGSSRGRVLSNYPWMRSRGQD